MRVSQLKALVKRCESDVLEFKKTYSRNCTNGFDGGKIAKICRKVWRL